MQGFDHKNPFFWGVILVQVQYLLLALGMTLKFYITVARVKTKSQNFLGVNSFVCRSYREKLAGGLFVPTPILNRVIIDACVVAFCVFFLKKKLLLNLRILLEHVIFQYVTVFWNWEYSKLVLLMRFWSTIVCKFFFEKLKNQTKVDRARQL